MAKNDEGIVGTVIRYTDPTSGRFVSAGTAMTLESALRTVVVDGEVESQQVLSFGQVGEQVQGDFGPNWNQTDTKWGTSWGNDDNDLDLEALKFEPPPDEADWYRVRYSVEDNPDYPRGYASSDWVQIQDWPPRMDLVQGVAASGIAMIHFRTGNGGA